jgi:hypothetical protein
MASWSPSLNSSSEGTRGRKDFGPLSLQLILSELLVQALSSDVGVCSQPLLPEQFFPLFIT